MKEFKQILLGSMNGAEFAASLFFALATAFAIVLVRVKKRDPLSERTPYQFSWSFYWRDNIKQNVGTLLLIFLTIRISQKWVKHEWLVYGAIIIGLIADKLAMLILKLQEKVNTYYSNKIDAADEEIKNLGK